MIVEKREFIITIRSVPHRVPANNRLKRLLKTMLRTFGFRVVKISEQNDDVTANG